jgi:hypothetical protein
MPMKLPIFIALLLIITASGCSPSTENLPDYMKGRFQDDYGIQYEITEELWFQKPNARFHIEKLDIEKQYLIARNDTTNPSEPGLYTRFDWMKFENMQTYEWGFCMTTYNAATIQEAKEMPAPDRTNPKEGCNGFPFSRMQEVVD